MAFLDGHGLGRAAPFVIQWLGNEHPTQSLAEQGRLDAVAVGHPTPARVHDVLDVLGAEATAVASSDPWLGAAITTPRGPIELGGPR